MISGGMRSGEVGLSIDSIISGAKLKVGVVRYLNSDTSVASTRLPGRSHTHTAY